MKKPFAAILLASLLFFLAVYGTAYITLRATGQIVRNSNADHWHPEKQSPGHYVAMANEKDRLGGAVFKPPMFVEQAVRNAFECG